MIYLQPTNHLDMESIDALAKAINEFSGGMVLVSHDMRLISQVAREIWICDNKTITKHVGDIQTFKMDMREQMGIAGEQKGSKSLRGDASTIKKEKAEKTPPPPKKPTPTIEVVVPPAHKAVQLPSAPKPVVVEDDATAATTASSSTMNSEKSRYVPLHLRNQDGADSAEAPPGKARYVPPHLRE